MVYTWYIKRLYGDVQETGIQQPQLDKILNVNPNMHILISISLRPLFLTLKISFHMTKSNLSRMLYSLFLITNNRRIVVRRYTIIYCKLIYQTNYMALLRTNY